MVVNSRATILGGFHAVVQTGPTGLLIKACLWLVIVSLSARPIEAAQLEGCWNFDEGTGSTIADCSGNGRNGNIIGGAAWVSHGAGYALHFSGVPGQYVDIPGTSGLNFLTGGFTLSAWVKLTGPNADHVIVGKHKRFENNGYFLGSGGDRFSFHANEPRIATVETYQDGQWHHVVGVFDGATMFLFVDGALKMQMAQTYSAGSIRNITIGGLVDGVTSAGLFVGDIDDVTIYSGVPDADSDGIPDLVDNCPNTINPDQADCDGDGQGDVCDTDIDGDGVANGSDVCPSNCQGVPSGCDGRPLRDCNNDCNVDGLDLQCIVDEMLGG
jgi:hypothetical protein